jgi:hypothetical protein
LNILPSSRFVYDSEFCLSSALLFGAANASLLSNGCASGDPPDTPRAIQTEKSPESPPYPDDLQASMFSLKKVKERSSPIIQAFLSGIWMGKRAIAYPKFG